MLIWSPSFVSVCDILFLYYYSRSLLFVLFCLVVVIPFYVSFMCVCLFSSLLSHLCLTILLFIYLRIFCNTHQHFIVLFICVCLFECILLTLTSSLPLPSYYLHPPPPPPPPPAPPSSFLLLQLKCRCLPYIS